MAKQEPKEWSTDLTHLTMLAATLAGHIIASESSRDPKHVAEKALDHAEAIINEADRRRNLDYKTPLTAPQAG